MLTENGKRSSISVQSLVTGVECKHVILYDEELMQQFNNENDMFIDATFKIRPKVKGLQQVLTIMLRKNNIVNIMKFFKII